MYPIDLCQRSKAENILRIFTKIRAVLSHTTLNVSNQAQSGAFAAHASAGTETSEPARTTP